MSMLKHRYNRRESFLGSFVVGVILLSFVLSPFSMLIQVAYAAPPSVTFTTKWTTNSLGNGLWEGGVVIGDVVKSTPGEEVVFATDQGGGRVYCLNGRTGKTIWTYDDSSIYAYAQATLYDLDGDGNLEVCVPLYYLPGLLVLRSNGTRWWRTAIANAGTTMGSFAAADVNGDGKLEIFHGSQNVEAGADGRFVGRITKLSYDGKILAQTFNWRACSGGVSIADADNDGVFEIYTGDRDMYMNDANYGRGVRSFWADNLTERWCMPDILCSSQCPDLADVNGDGVLDVIVSDMSGGVLVLNSTSGSAKPTPPFRKTGSIGVPGHYQTTVCDIDGDGHLEMIAADGTHSNSRIPNYSNKFVIYDLVTGVIEKELIVGQCMFSPTVADLNGDGKMDIIACNQTAIIVFTYDNGDYVKIGERGNLLSGLKYAMVQDIDNDGLLEVVVSRGSGSSARVYAFDLGANSHAPALRARSEIKWYSEYRRGVAEYVAPPHKMPIEELSVSGSEKIAAEPMLAAEVLNSFGNTDNVTTSQVNVASYFYGSRYQIPENGEARSISLRVWERDGEDRPLEVAIYSDGSGVPTSLLAQGSSTIPASFSGWITVDLSSFPSLSANNYYWLIANANASGRTVRFYYSTGATNQGVYGSANLATFPTDPCQYSGRNTRAFCISCNYAIPPPSGPTMVSHSPDGPGVPVGTTIEATFSEAMDHDSTENAFSMDPTVSGTFSWSLGDTVMTFTPDSNLDYGTLYAVDVTTAAQSQGSEYLDKNYGWSFTTEANPSEVLHSFGKTVRGSSQVNLAQYWYGSRYPITEDGEARSISLYVQNDANNRPLKVAIYQDSSGVPTTLLAQGVSTVPASFAGWFNVSLSSYPSLSAGNYYWLVANGKSLSGALKFYYDTGSTNQGVYGTTTYANFPTDPCQSSGRNTRAFSIYCNYSTTPPPPPPPYIVSHVPDDDAVDVSRSANIEVTFSEPMDRTSTQNAFTIVPLVSGTFSWGSGDTVMTFNPSSNLDFGTQYTVTVSTAAQSKEGEDLMSYPPWSFWTVESPPPETEWILERLPNGDIVCRNGTYADPSVFNWYVNDYEHPTTSTPDSLTRLLLTFDKNDPNNVQDSSPYGNNGQVHGATWTNEHGGAYYFDGKFDYIKIPDGGSGYFNGYPEPRVGDLMSDGNKSEMSLEMWVYLSESQSGVRFVSKIPSYEIGIWSNGRLFAGVFRQTGTDHTELGYLGNTRVTAPTSAPIGIGSWQHVAFTYKDGVGLRLFLNGVMVASANAVGNIHCSSGIPLMIGWFDYFKGMIDDVRMYGIRLSDQQIYQRYLEGKEGWTNSSIIKSAQTRGQEKWKCNVITSGKSTWALTEGGLDYIEIPNNAPSADNLVVGPRKTLQPIDTDALTATYAYHDLDENVELGSEIRWYRNGALQSGLNNILTVPASSTSVGDAWYFTVRPRDGKDFGTIATSPTVNIISNNRPIQGTPSIVKSSGNLVCTATATDSDGPLPTREIYNWRVGGTSISNLQMPFDTDNMISGAKDYSPTANNGVVSGATWTQNGMVGGAYNFDGNDVITCADNNLGGDAAGTWTELTMEFWIKVDAWLAGTRIVAKKVGTSSSGSYMVGFQSTPDTSISNGNQLFFSVTTDIDTTDTWDDGNPATHANNVLTPGNWYHIVCTYKSGPGLTVYINGTQTVNVPATGTIKTETEFVPGDEPLYIGSDGSGNANRYLTGTLDELTIYNRALTLQQVSQRWQESKNGLSSSSTIVAQETSTGQTWTCMVTPNDKYGDGTSVLSN